MMYMGETTMEKATGAVESTLGALAIAAKHGDKIPLVGRYAGPWFGRYAGPLAATLTVSWTTLSWLGETTVGALYGMIQLGLNQAYKDLRTHALEVHGEATQLAVMIEMKLKDREQVVELHKRIETFVSILASSIRGYVDRTRVSGGDRDPGTWDAFRIRFAPLVGVSLETPFEVLAAAEQFLDIAVSCFKNAGAVLEESVQQSVREHGEANKHRF